MMLCKISTYQVIFTTHKDYGYMFRQLLAILMYEGWNFNSGNYLFTTDTK